MKREKKSADPRMQHKVSVSAEIKQTSFLLLNVSIATCLSLAGGKGRGSVSWDVASFKPHNDGDKNL